MSYNSSKASPVGAVLGNIQKSNDHLGALRANSNATASATTAAGASNLAAGLAQHINIPSTQTVVAPNAPGATAVRGPTGFGQMIAGRPVSTATGAASTTVVTPAAAATATAPTTVYDTMVQPMMQTLPSMGDHTVANVEFQRMASTHAAAATCSANVMQQQQTLQQQQQVLSTMLQQSGTTDHQLMMAQNQKRALEQQVQQQQQHLQALDQQLRLQQQQQQQQQQSQAPSAAKAGLFSSLRAQQEEVNDFASQDAAMRSAGSTTSTVGGSMYGLDEAVIEQILNDPTSKYHNSKFIKLISQIRSGQVHFKDGDLVPVTLEEAQAKAAQEAAAAYWGEEDDDVQEVDTSQFHAYDDYEYDPNEEVKIAEDALKRTHEWINQYKEAYGLSAEAKGDAQEDDEDTIYLNTQDDAARMWREYVGEDGGEQKSGTNLPTSIAELLARAQERIRKGNVVMYDFAEENQFQDDEDALRKGLEYMEADQLALAIAAFEAAVQKDSENSEAWWHLGNANNQFAAAEQAQAALFRCLELDPYNLQALVLLGVSLVNSHNLVKALEYLKLWIKRNPEYQGRVDLSSLEAYELHYAEDSAYALDPQHVDPALLGEVVKVFQSATQVNPNDHELFNVLGVLYHLSQDYDMATEAFQNAVRLNPSDTQLWNRLGATMATNGHPTEALKVYDQALQSRPNNVRLLSNRVVAYYNSQQYENAIKAALQTLVINRDQSMMWDYLRSCLFRIDRADLIELMEHHDPNVYRAYFEF